MIYPISPVAKPRQTRSDKWKQRACVMKYRTFKDECRLRKVTVSSGDEIIFFVPMPPSWSEKKKIRMLSKPHTQTPDIDNLLKALLDAVHKDDSHIWYLAGLTKVWAREGAIEVRR